MSYQLPRGSDWLAGIAAGTALGAVFLGVGGRLGMRAIALANGQPPTASFEGSLTVVLLGAASGAVIGAIFMLARLLFAQNRLLRVTFFWTLVGALVLRGLHPLSIISVAVFAPLFVAHGALLFAYWCRIRLRRVTLAPSGA